jgi:hypothetical protein
MHGNDIYDFTARSRAIEQDPVSIPLHNFHAALSPLAVQATLEICTAQIRIRNLCNITARS